MTTFREIYNRGEYPYQVVVDTIHQNHILIDFAAYIWAPNSKSVDLNTLDSDAYQFLTSRTHRLEIYSTFEGVADRLEYILRKTSENACSLSISSIRRALITIYTTKKKEQLC